MTDSNPVWALRGVRPSTKRLFKQVSALKDVNIGEFADQALRAAAEKALADIIGAEDAKKLAERVEHKPSSMKPI